MLIRDAVKFFKSKFFYLTLILFTAFLLRSRGMFNPLLDAHSWRQTFTATVAYNFYSSDMNILQPRLNVFPEINEVEFHLYPFTVAVLYKVFGFHEHFGKLVSIFFGLGTIFFIYLMAKRYFSELSASAAALFWTFSPMTIYYNRTFMPESAMLFCSVAGVYFFLKWLDAEEKISHFVASAIFIGSALLLKATCLYLFIPMFYAACVKHGGGVFKKPSLYVYLFLSLTGPFLWYYYSHRVFQTQVGGSSIWDIGADKWFNKAILLSPGFYQRVWLQHLGELHFAFSGYLFFWIGLFLPLKKEARFLRVWVFAIFLFFIVVAMGNYVHEYYQLPLMIAGSIFVGRGVEWFVEKIKRGGKKYYADPVFYALAVLILWIPIYGFTKSAERMKFDVGYKFAADKISEISAVGEKIVVISHSEPEVFYYARRKGWHINTDTVSVGLIKEYKNSGAKYVVVMGRRGETSRDMKCPDMTPSIGPKETAVADKLKKEFRTVSATGWYYIFKL
ncbi:MAG: glycosyltransferase family 39 protein [Endomicrobiia bacterium]|nr:glycosyltransferase family 39 protein [Endomicrobiia bacterium]